MNAKQVITFIIVALCSVVAADAQTYLEHVKQTNTPKGSVVVTQSKEIDDLVNGNAKTAATANASGKEVQDKSKNGNAQTAGSIADAKQGQQPANASEEAARAAAMRREAEARRIAEAKEREAAKNEKEGNEMEIPTVDTRKKVMRGSRKMTGYRVQAFAGGNTRNDKQKAQQIGSAIKMRFPDQPVYVHFYSPRWICRVGNFRSYQEAESVLKQVRAMGYRSATIVKGQITVQY